ncbi:MAG: ribosomal protein S18-alanine N-acetyltransferase [Clostridiales bacterium]|nr:ribosomal protein S18-alanine N-acetyltransferase [Clostridiales bacterium]
MNFVPYNAEIAKREPVRYRLVPMTAELVDQVAEIERMNFSRPWTQEMLLEELDNMLASYICALGENGVVLGYAGLTVVAGEGYINNIAVRQEYRKQGVASALLDVFTRFAQAQGLEFLTLELRVSNEAAKRLYLKHGFAQVGRRKDYYDDPKEDAILMTRTFGDEGREQP